MRHGTIRRADVGAVLYSVGEIVIDKSLNVKVAVVAVVAVRVTCRLYLTSTMSDGSDDAAYLQPCAHFFHTSTITLKHRS